LSNWFERLVLLEGVAAGIRKRVLVWRNGDHAGTIRREAAEMAAPMMSGLISVVLGCALGGTARYFLSGVVARHVGETFPWGTLMVNVSGAFLIGIFGALAQDHASLLAAPDPWLFAVTGFLGCYTTVSSFSLQTLALARDGEGGRAIGYVAISVALSIGAVGVGFALVDLPR
jgi:fluoride exporter